MADAGPSRDKQRALGAMGEARRSILVAIKRHGALGIAELAEHSQITYEAVRQHLTRLEADGWIGRRLDRAGVGPGRPPSVYHLTAAGDHLFPKEYDELAVALLDAAGDRLGADAVRVLLEEVARRKVESLLPRTRAKPLQERLTVLRDIYQPGDPFCRVEYGDGDAPRLVEMNCPYLEVAKRRPALCSVTVSVLRRLLGRKVVRSERFQDGDGRCVFKVLGEAPESAPLFDWEPEP